MQQLGDLGQILEGTIEIDPMDERLQLRTFDSSGNPVTVDLQEVLREYQGQEVRVAIASLSGIQELQDMVEKLGGIPDGLEGLTLPRRG